MIFDGEVMRVTLPRSMHEALDGNMAKNVCLGVRPRSIALPGSGKDSPGAFDAEIDVTEMLGEEMLVHLQAGEHRFVMSINPRDLPRREGCLRVSPDPSRCHIFDRESGRNITAGVIQ
jgi:ABC-type sugar transport system ATPase subunit